MPIRDEFAGGAVNDEHAIRTWANRAGEDVLVGRLISDYCFSSDLVTVSGLDLSLLDPFGFRFVHNFQNECPGVTRSLLEAPLRKRG